MVVAMQAEGFDGPEALRAVEVDPGSRGPGGCGSRCGRRA